MNNLNIKKDISTKLESYKPNKLSNKNERLLSVGICGAPNVGKSTLLNTLIGEKISAVSPKRNTTRNSITGIKNIKNTQLLFFDTPGFIQRGVKNKEEKGLMATAESTLIAMDACLTLIDGTSGLTPISKDVLDKVINTCFVHNVNLYLVINKIDEVNPKTNLLALARDMDIYTNECINNYKQHIEELNEFQRSFNYKYLYMISAKERDGTEDIVHQLVDDARTSPWLYARNSKNTTGFQGILMEIVREKVFLLLHKELPYRIQIVNDIYEEKEDSIHANFNFIITNKHHKRILQSVLSTIYKQVMREVNINTIKPITLSMKIQVNSNQLNPL
ncbi:hypothetical protein WA158_003290 [Blastocystis sp. Blastoise]